MKDLFDRFYQDKGPVGKWAEQAEGYFVFPKLEGPISNRMYFMGKEVITWSINDYLGLANHPEVVCPRDWRPSAQLDMPRATKTVETHYAG